MRFLHSRQTGHSSRSWLPAVRFTSLEERPARRLYDDGRRAGSVGSFFPEIKRSVASHSGKKDARLDGRVLFRIAGAGRALCPRRPEI